MSKKKGKKRVLKRKVKRTIRYTVAALFMVTAIIVAAIPAQTNRADGGGGGATVQADQRTDDQKTYSYEFKDTRTPVANPSNGNTGPDSGSAANGLFDKITNADGVQLNLYHDSTYKDGDPQIKKAYSVIQVSNGRYYLNWQYKYYEVGSGSDIKGIICKYNNDFSAEAKKLEVQLPTSYNTYTQKDFDDLFADTSIISF